MNFKAHWFLRSLLAGAAALSLLAVSGISFPAQAGQVPAPAVEQLIYLPVAMQQHWVPYPQYPTGILDIDAFLETCPQSDPNYAQLIQDFQVRVDGVVVTSIPCTEPVSAMPDTQKTEELRALQAFRLAYYLDPKIPSYLPWTSKTLYNWMKGNVSGINFKTTSTRLYCCDWIGGKPFISSYVDKNDHRTWSLEFDGVGGLLFFFAHEARHRDPDDPGHVEGCKDFPLGSGVYGCDPSYDETRLGAYGVHRWLYKSIASGYFNIGIACSPDAFYIISNMIFSTNGYRDRFVTNIPESLPMPAPPYGGPCLAP